MPENPGTNYSTMKLSKLITAGLLVAGIASMADAQTVIRFTGSTAYRKQVVQAIEDALGGSTHYACAYAGSGPETSASYAIFSGSFGGSNVIIKTSWSGSEAGVQAVAQDGTGLPIAFLPNSVITSATIGAAAVSTTNATVNEVPDIDLCDTFQSTSRFYTPAGAAGIVIGGTSHTFPALLTSGSYPDGVVGVVPFVWVATNGGKIGTSGTVQNITNQQLQALYTVTPGSGLPLSFLTGLTSDASSYAFPTGRNPDSGTRLTSLAEAGIGAISSVTQYQPVDISGSTPALVTATTQTIGQIRLWPADSVNGISISTGNSGYSSGGQLASALGVATSSMSTPLGTGGILIAPVGTNDAPNSLPVGTYAASTAYPNSQIVGKGGVGALLNFNGVPYSATSIINGQYTFWGYEHLYFRSTDVQPFADAVSAAIYSTRNVIPVTALQVGRGSDGGTVTNGAAY